MPKKWKGRLEDIVDPDTFEFAFKVARSTTKNKKKRIVRKYESREQQKKLADRVSKPETYYPQLHTLFSFTRRIVERLGQLKHHTLKQRLWNTLLLQFMNNR